MTTLEFNNHVAAAANQDWFNNINEEISISPNETKYKFITAGSFFEFLIQQLEGWEKIKTEVPRNYYDKFVQPFTSTKQELENFIKTSKIQPNSHVLINNWDNIKRVTRDFRNTLTFDSPDTLFLLKISKSDSKAFDGAYQYLFDSIRDINSPGIFRGAIFAYEFRQKGKSEITDRREAESASLENLKAEFRNDLIESRRKVDEVINETRKEVSANNIEISEEKKKY